MVKLFLLTDYSLLKPIKRNLENYQLWNLQETFDTAVTLTGQIKADQTKALEIHLREISNGKIHLQIL